MSVKLFLFAPVDRKVWVNDIRDTSALHTLCTYLLQAAPFGFRHGHNSAIEHAKRDILETERKSRSLEEISVLW